MLPEDQIQSIKQQLIQQINSTFPEDKKQEALKQIDAMNAEQLEQFLIQNNLIKPDKNNKEPQQCVFCLIIENKIPTNKIAENQQAIATLEINPISKAHTIIIPKIHSEEVPQKALELAQEIANKIKQLFNPKDIKIYTSKLFGHEIINILPVYTNETKDSEKKQSSQEELQEIQKQLIETPAPEKKPEPVKEKPKQEIISDKTHWLPKRKP